MVVVTDRQELGDLSPRHVRVSSHKSHSIGPRTTAVYIYKSQSSQDPQVARLEQLQKNPRDKVVQMDKSDTTKHNKTRTS